MHKLISEFLHHALPYATLLTAIGGLLSAATALVAVIVGPYFNSKQVQKQLEGAEKNIEKQLKFSRETFELDMEESRLKAEQQLGAARRSANKQIVAPMREAWISKIREMIARYLTVLNFIIVKHKKEPSDTETLQQVQLKISEFQLLSTEIILMLNPEESEQYSCITIIGELTGLPVRAGNGEQCGAEYMAKSRELMQLARIMFKKEWNRVKTEDAN